mmetsp:Transcript_90969/g.294428  ORF Transcript_90969/g.294428 Transcript_90969/m.294428 type:complete len:215 (+) Transcript_90969:1638-2282(+)
MAHDCAGPARGRKVRRGGLGGRQGQEALPGCGRRGAGGGHAAPGHESAPGAGRGQRGEGRAGRRHAEAGGDGPGTRSGGRGAGAEGRGRAADRRGALCHGPGADRGLLPGGSPAVRERGRRALGKARGRLGAGLRPVPLRACAPPARAAWQGRQGCQRGHAPLPALRRRRGGEVGRGHLRSHGNFPRGLDAHLPIDQGQAHCWHLQGGLGPWCG